MLQTLAKLYSGFDLKKHTRVCLWCLSLWHDNVFFFEGLLLNYLKFRGSFPGFSVKWIYGCHNEIWWQHLGELSGWRQRFQMMPLSIGDMQWRCHKGIWNLNPSRVIIALFLELWYAWIFSLSVWNQQPASKLILQRIFLDILFAWNQKPRFVFLWLTGCWLLGSLFMSCTLSNIA